MLLSGLYGRTWSEEFLVTWRLWSPTWRQAASRPPRSHSYSPSHRSRPPLPRWSLLLGGRRLKTGGITLTFFRLLPFHLNICFCWSCWGEQSQLLGSHNNKTRACWTETDLYCKWSRITDQLLVLASSSRFSEQTQERKCFSSSISHRSNHVRDASVESKHGEPANQFALASYATDIPQPAGWLRHLIWQLEPNTPAFHPSISPPTDINGQFPLMAFQAISVWPKKKHISILPLSSLN